MPRKGPAAKRTIVNDPVYGAPIVTQLINKVLLDGKRSTAERIVYGALDSAADDLLADTGKVADATTADEDDRVLLQVVTDARDVGRDLDARAEAHTGDLAQSGVRLLRGRGVHARAHAATLRAPLEGRSLVLGDLVLPTLADQLLDGWHTQSSHTLSKHRMR